MFKNHGDYFITITNILLFVPLAPHKKKKKYIKIIVPPNIVFSKIRIKPLELAFETLGICCICIFKKP